MYSIQNTQIPLRYTVYNFAATDGRKTEERFRAVGRARDLRDEGGSKIVEILNVYCLKKFKDYHLYNEDGKL